MTVFAASDYPFLKIFWTILIFFAWVIFIWIASTVLVDLFRRRDLSAAAWVIFVIVLPYLGELAYLILTTTAWLIEAATKPLPRRRSSTTTYVQGRRHRRTSQRDRDGKTAARQRRHRQAEFEAIKAKAIGSATPA